MSWDELWDLIPDQFRTDEAGGYANFVAAIDELCARGWITKNLPWISVQLTATAWLKLNIGIYPYA